MIYIRKKQYDKCAGIMENEGLYREAVKFLFKYQQRNEAAFLAGKYLRDGNLSLNDIEIKVLEHGKQLGRKYCDEKEKDKLLAVIPCFSPKLQIKYLREIKDYQETARALQNIDENTEAYNLLLEQGFYHEAFSLINEKEVIFRYTKSWLKKVSSKHVSAAAATTSTITTTTSTTNSKDELVESDITEDLSSDTTVNTFDPLFDTKLREFKGLKEISDTLATSCLLYGKLYQDPQCCRKAMMIYRELKHRAGECEASFAWTSMHSKRNNIEYIRNIIAVCKSVKLVITALQSHGEKCDASLTEIRHQVERFYTLKTVGSYCVLPEDQSIWIKSLTDDAYERDGNLLRLKHAIVCKVICNHMKKSAENLLDHEDVWTTLKKTLELFSFHGKLSTGSCKCKSKELYDYLKAYILCLEVHCYLSEFSMESRKVFQHLQQGFPDLIAENATIYIRFGEDHFKLIRQLEEPVSNILKERIKTVFDKHTHKIKMDELLSAWVLLHAMRLGDASLNENIRSRTITMYSRDKHFFTHIDIHKQAVHVFHRWVQSCLLLRGDNMALIAAKILTSFIEIIARRKSLLVTPLNMVYFMSVCTMTAYSLLAFSDKNIVIVVPEQLRGTMISFDKLNCQQEGDTTIFQTCKMTSMCVRPEKMRTASNCLLKVLDVLIGKHNFFNPLRKASIRLLNSKELVSCLTLALTLLSNMLLSGYFKYPCTLLYYYQREILSSLDPLKENPSVSLQNIYSSFQSCSSVRAIFQLISDLNSHEVEFYKFQQGKNLQLKKVYLNKIPNIKMSPLDAGDGATRGSVSKLKHTPETRPYEDISSAVVERNHSTLPTEKDHVPNTAIVPVENIQEHTMDEGKQELKFTSQISEDEIYEKEVTEALMTLKEETEEATENGLDVNTYEIDYEFCQICGISIEADKQNGLDIRKEHLESKDHAFNEPLYKTFHEKMETQYKPIKFDWEEEVKEWKKLNYINKFEDVIHDGNDELRKFEDKLNEIRGKYQWQQGIDELLTLVKNICKLLEHGKAIYTHFKEREIKAEENSEENENDSSDELSDLELDADPKKKKRERIKKKRLKGN